MVAEPTQQAAASAAASLASSSTPVPSAEEEALKRNTDCVYFLASPLTCKKGSECEYRHSEYARINPRDCWYWLNGNCLNPKCAFRHPPLDGLFGAQVPTTAGITSPAQQISVPSSSHNSSNNPGRKAVPCVFFQKGHCLRGDKCSFFHGTNSSGNKVQQPTPATSSGDLLTSKKPASTLKICSQEHQAPAHFSKPLGQHLSAKLLPDAVKNTPRKVGIVQESSLAINADEEFPLSRSSHPPSSRLQSKSGQLHQTHAFPEHNFQNDKEADDFMRESSPGFDVLVDDELGDPEFYQGEDQFGRAGNHEGRISSSMNKCDVDHLTDYNSLSVFDREQLHDQRIYDSYDQISGQRGWEECQDLSEMVLGRRSHREGRSRVNGDGPEIFHGSDLRQRLSKQRRVIGLRSVVSNAFIPDYHLEEPDYQRSSQRDSQHPSSNEGSLSGRLRGRVKFPGKSVDKPDWEMDRGRSLGRLHQGRVSDRLKGRLQEENSDTFRRSSSGPRARREIWDGNSANFTGPKSLAELKSTGQQGKGRESTLSSRQEDANSGGAQLDANPSFEGPKPLSVLLKRKRETDTLITEGSIQLVNGGATTKSSPSHFKGDDHMYKEESTEVELMDGMGNVQRGTCGDQAFVWDDVNPSELKEDIMAVQDEAGEHELEGDDQQDGEYYYEDEGEYNYDGDNADEAYVDEEDGDEFAKKVDVILS